MSDDHYAAPHNRARPFSQAGEPFGSGEAAGRIRAVVTWRLTAALFFWAVGKPPTGEPQPCCTLESINTHGRLRSRSATKTATSCRPDSWCTDSWGKKKG